MVVTGRDSMSRGPKLSDVAAAAKVHQSTASRALDPNLSSRLSPEVVERVRRIADELGYSRNAIAASLRMQRSRMVGVIVPDLTNTMFPPMFRGIEDRLSADGYSAILANSDLRPAKERAIIETYLDRRLDGMILASAHLDDAEQLDALARKVPVVLMNREIADASVTAVIGDDAGGIAEMFAHLAGLGHRRIAHIAGPQDTSTGVARRDAFLAASRQAGCDFDGRLLVAAETYSEREGYRCARHLLEAGGGPTAILAANDWLAIGCLTAIEEAGLSCPRDISVTGFNDMPFADRMRPPLTTIRIPHYRMGFEAAEHLLALIAAPDTPASRVVMPPALIVRGSTTRPRADGIRRT
jgi:LacI family transcriptional regulator